MMSQPLDRDDAVPGLAAPTGLPVRPSRLRPLWGFLLSIMPGLGHVYARLWTLGVALLALNLIGAVSLPWLTRLVAPTPPAIMAFLAAAVLAILFQIAVAVDAARRNRTALDRPRPRWFRSTWFTAMAYSALAAPMVGVFGTVGWRSFSMPSASMEPALRVGDFAVFSAAAGLPAIPVRGSVVVFTLPDQTGTDYVKRVIGLPGDRIALHEGLVLLNGAPLPRVADGTFAVRDGELPPIITRRFLETLPGGPTFPILKLGSSNFADEMTEVTVPPDRMFVLGDYRDNSLDSRFARFGMVPISNLVATLGTRYWSRDRTRLFQPVQ